MVEKGSIDRQSYGSPIRRVWGHACLTKDSEGAALAGPTRRPRISVEEGRVHGAIVVPDQVRWVLGHWERLDVLKS